MEHAVFSQTGLVCLLLLLHCTAVTVSQSCQEEAVEIIGTVTSTVLAGWLEICVGGEWHAIYDEEWSIADVKLVCAEKGFPSECATPCGNSCFGASTLPTGYAHFTCSKTNEFRFCDRFLVTQQLPNNNAGITCTMIVDDSCLPYSNSTSSPRATPSGPSTTPVHDYSLSTDCPDTTPCPDYTCPDPNNSVATTTSPIASPTMCPTPSPCPTTLRPDHTKCPKVKGSRERCAAMGAVLGVIIIILLLTLVGVVTGWVWSYRKNRIILKNWSEHAQLAVFTFLKCKNLEDCSIQPTSIRTSLQIREQRKIQGLDDMSFNACYSRSTPISMEERQGKRPEGDYEPIKLSTKKSNSQSTPFSMEERQRKRPEGDYESIKLNTRESNNIEVREKTGFVSKLETNACSVQEISSAQTKEEQGYEKLEFHSKI